MSVLAALATAGKSKIGLTGFSVSVETLITAFAVVFGTFVVSRLVRYSIQRAVDRRGGDQHAAVTGKKISSYLVYSLGFVFLLGVFGLPLSALGAALGLIGLGISFALKDMIANFISGLLILVNRPIKIGDQIRVSGEEGTVKDISIRATEVRTYDGRQVIVPNSQIYSGTVVNNTGYGERRFEVVVGVGYDDDIDEAKELAMESLEEAEDVEEEPEPQVLVSELGGSSVDLKLRGWTRPSRANMVQASSQVTQLVKEKYDEAGIDIPYPIRTVQLEEQE